MGDTRRLGVTLAAATALISGVSVFVNGLAVQAWAGAADPTTYTTVKNAIAAALLVGVGLVGARRGWSDGWRRPTSRRQWWGLGAVAVVGGSVPFVLFFEGLARSESLQAALLHKSLVIWVAILAVGLLGERLGPWHWLAIGAVVIGQVLYAGGVTDVAFGAGELMILAATLLWSVEVVLAKRLLGDLPSSSVGIARMAGGTVVLVGWGLVRGAFDGLPIGPIELGWVLLTGLLLAAYVGTWFAALARAQAVDVTAVLVGATVVTAFVGAIVDGTPVGSPLGLALIAGGAIVAGWQAARSRAERVT